MVTTANRLSASRLRPYLVECGYRSSLIEASVRLPDDAQNPRAVLAAFAYPPCDSRSACIAALDGFADPLQDAMACRPLGAPVIFVCYSEHVEWWVQATGKTERRESIAAEDVGEFFATHRQEFSPDAIYRAKTIARFDPSFQLEFVDVGLMPLVEGEAGRKLVEIIEQTVIGTKQRLGWKEVTPQQGQWLLQANFWLLAARILKDKGVPAFTELELEDLDSVYSRLAKHYGAEAPVAVESKEKIKALRVAAQEISRRSHLGLVSTEALAHLYERALITKETRSELGTHSTPTYLVDYIVGRLRTWIAEIPYEKHDVFEPACGHAAFLLATMRLLGELLPKDLTAPSARHHYLQTRLHGGDIDPFALEIARLSLTLADVPNPNGWDLKLGNMFAGDWIADHSRNATLVLANPPFEDFTQEERAALLHQNSAARFNNKAAEMLWRVTDTMRPGAVFGVVLPQGLLHGKNATPLREFLSRDFEIAEICLFPDKVFTFSDSESVVMLGRRLQPGVRQKVMIAYRQVREADVENFKRSYEVTNEFAVTPSRLTSASDYSFLIPDLEDVWNFCRDYPKFEQIAEIGKGLEFRSQFDPSFPKGAVTESINRKRGFVQGFARLHEELLTHQLPSLVWLNLDPAVIRCPLHGTTRGVPQVLLNYARVSRGAWRLKGFMDRTGHPVTGRFLVIRPNNKHWRLETIWAICNSPLANAYSYAFSAGKRDVLGGLMRRMPIPRVESSGLKPLAKAVRAYLRAVRGMEGAVSGISSDRLRLLHWRIDAEVLRLYQLPSELEFQILRRFSNVQRTGVPFDQKEYFPKMFTEPVSLHDLLAISADWEKTNARRERLILKEERKTIRPPQKDELRRFQRLTDVRIKLLAPLPVKELESIASELKRRGLWLGSEA